MNRRSFLSSLTALSTFTILPGAGRVWRAERPMEIIVPVLLRVFQKDGDHLVPMKMLYTRQNILCYADYTAGERYDPFHFHHFVGNLRAADLWKPKIPTC